MKSLSTVSFCVLLALVCGAGPSSGRPAAARAAQDDGDVFAEPVARKPHSVDEIAWLAGVWSGKGLGGDVEEHWSKPVAGSMMGMFRLVQRDATGFFEFILIEEVEGVVSLRFQHFNPGYSAWEKNGPLAFELIDCTQGRAVFESKDTKQSPARVVYSLRDGRSLGVLIESPEALGGPISFEVLYERVPGS